MPEPGDADARTLLTRRQGLLALALAATGTALAACASSAEPPAPSTVAPTTAPVSPTVADEQSLVLQYDQAIAAQPSLASVLQPIRDQHLQHLTALGAVAPQGSAPSSSAAGGSGATTAKAALQSLIAAETAAAKQRADAAVAESEPAQARTLTFIAASEASHVPALKAAR